MQHGAVERFYLRQKRDVRREQPLGELHTQSGLEELCATICSPSEAAMASCAEQPRVWRRCG